jgi:hypothetical protein
MLKYSQFSQAGEYTKKGVRGLSDRLSRVPLIPEHRAGVQAQTMASVNTTQATSYTPYTRFSARGPVCASNSGRTPNSNDDDSQSAGAHQVNILRRH